MPLRILILGASYGSLLGTKIVAAGHAATLVCRAETAALINDRGTEVRLRLRGEEEHRSLFSRDLPGALDAATPQQANPADFDLVCLAMQEPQYAHPDLAALLGRVAATGVPCMSIMNMPPLPYLRRIPALKAAALDDAFLDPEVWAGFEPGLVTLCSPDPQAYRPPDAEANVLHVGLPTNFKVSAFPDPAHTALLERLSADIDAVRIEGRDVPVKLRLFDSPFVPFAKWAMLAAGNYRCVLARGERAIREAVHDDIAAAREIYEFVNGLVLGLGGAAEDLVAFEKYAAAARDLAKPSSVARAIAGGATEIERVDRLIARVAAHLGRAHPELERIVATVDARLDANRRDARAQRAG